MKSLFDKEKENLFKDLHSLPRSTSLRKIGDLGKRAKAAKVHGLIVDHLRSQFSSFGWPFSESATDVQERLLKNIQAEFDKVAAKHHFVQGDMPDPAAFVQTVRKEGIKLWSYPGLDKRQLAAIDTLLQDGMEKLLATVSEKHDE